jgi:hypothetical protein
MANRNNAYKGRALVHTSQRGLSVLLAIAVAALSLVACGGGGGSDEVVARVAGVGGITKASLEHWIPVEAIVLYQEHPMTPVPKGVIPDPPDYAACIAYLGRAPRKVGEPSGKLSPKQLKGRCEAQSKELKVLTLNTLISWYWTIAAGKSLGYKASDAEVKSWLKVFAARTFPKRGEYETYLRVTGQTTSDMLLRGRGQLLEKKVFQQLSGLQARLPKGLTAQQRQSATAKLAEAVPPGKRWAAITTCRKGYVVSACKEYAGSLPPGIPN